MSEQPDESHCPTPTAHKRLSEAHQFWHECLDSFQSPEGFRIKLNACIQALRNVTFVLQSEKDLHQDFDAWYAPWQETMKADPIMVWVNESRVKVVHRSDLDTVSRLRVRIVSTYYDAADEVLAGLPRDPDEGDDGFAVAPALEPDDVVDELRKRGVPTAIINQSTISLERRWVDRELPDYEVLDALAHAYGVLSLIVADAHDQAGVAHSVMYRHEDPTEVPRDHLPGGRLPCMVTSRADRTLNIDLADGKVAQGGLRFSTTPDESKLDLAQKRYKAQPVRMEAPPEDVVELLPVYIENTLAILRSGDEHGWFVFPFRGLTPLPPQTLYARDAKDKRALAQELAEMVAVNRVDGLIEIGEVWQAPPTLDSEGAYIPPGQHKERTEGLVIHAETAAGRVRSVYIPFRRRKFRKPEIETPIDLTDGTENYFLEPTRAVWRSWSGARPGSAGQDNDSDSEAAAETPPS